jgi:Uncharacterized conserved protein
MHYIAVFHPAEEHLGGYVVTFPDLPGCVTQGEDFAHAFAMSQEALEGYLDALRRDGDPIPKPSDFQEARGKAETEAGENGENLSSEAILQAIPAPPQGTPVRVNVSMSSTVLECIDRFAKAEGLTRSGFLSVAAWHYLDQLAANAAQCPATLPRLHDSWRSAP